MENDMKDDVKGDLLGYLNTPMRPPEAMLRQPFNRVDSVTYLYCLKCSTISELNQTWADLLTQGAKVSRSETIYKQGQHFFRSTCCPACSGAETPAVTIEEIAE